MRRFTLIVLAYLLLCLLIALGIVLHGDGPHPRLLSIYPPNGTRYWPGGIAQLTFSQPMDVNSVERALQVTPGSQGQGAWYGNTLNLQPVGDWKPNVTYRLSLRGTVTDTEGRPLKTPISLWFRVHHVDSLVPCTVGHIRNVCEPIGRAKRPITHSPQPVLSFALSDDGTILAYTRRDRSGLPHLYLLQMDGTGEKQVTFGRAYADSAPVWSQGNSSSVSYRRRPVRWRHGHAELGKAQLWNVESDGSLNSPL